MARVPDGPQHLLVGLAAGKEPVDQVRRRYAEQRREPRLELVLIDPPRLERDQKVATRAILAEPPPDGVGLEALELAERTECVEHVAGENAAPIDQKALVSGAISVLAVAPAAAAVLRSHAVRRSARAGRSRRRRRRRSSGTDRRWSPRAR